jgi:hypothetical protein
MAIPDFWRGVFYWQNLIGYPMNQIHKFALIVLVIALSCFWVVTAYQRDKSRDMEYFWRQKYIESKALLGISIRQTDMVIMLNNYDTQTWDMYCEHKEAFKVNLARKANEE